MWEAVTDKMDEPNEPWREPPRRRAKKARKPKADTRSGENLVLWAQLILCSLILAGSFCAKHFALPWYAQVRSSYETILSVQSDSFLSEERQFIKFAQACAQSLRQSVQEVWLSLPGREPLPAAAQTAETAETARARRSRKKEAPSGSSLETYLPGCKMSSPLAAALVVNSGYGWRTLSGQTAQDFHTGVDLNANEGDCIYAAADGVVRQAQLGSSYGNYVRILQQGGDETIYAHMQYVFVRPGQQVRMGQVIGTVGHTGNATGPHLHFEILHEGVRYDPQTLLEHLAG